MAKKKKIKKNPAKILSGTSLEKAVRTIVTEAPAVDMHTHLFYPSFSDLFLRGIDDMLNYHYLVAEALHHRPVEIEKFWSLQDKEKADLIWRVLFVENSPVSEACRGIVTTLKAFSLDPSTYSLSEYRKFFSHLKPEDHLEIVLKKSKVASLVMTNDPFDMVEKEYWKCDLPHDPRFKTALRLDILLNRWPDAAQKIGLEGYDVSQDFSNKTYAEVRRFLDSWTKKISPVYFAVSLPPTFQYPDESATGKLLDNVVLPYCRDMCIPLALMIGIKRQTNPGLRLAGDSLGTANIDSIEHLCRTNPHNKFLVTMLGRENQQELCVTSRKFPNMMVFGCWWFLNTPGFIEEMTRMRLELLGTSFIPQHSDCRVLDQLIYKWEHSRTIIAKVLAEKYQLAVDAGWKITETEIKRDATRLLSQNFMDFIEE